MTTNPPQPGPKDGAVAAPPAQASSALKKGKKKAADPINTTKAIEDTIAQLEKSKAGDREQEAEIEREVKRATREMTHLLSRIGPQENKLDALQRKYTEMLADMKRTERELAKSKKRAELLQKEKDANRAEANKATQRRDVLEKLCRDLTKTNKRLEDDNSSLRRTQTTVQDQLHMRLEGMVEDVQQFIDLKEHPENQPAIIETDELFRQKFKSFIDQYELREIQFYALLKTKDLEVQFEKARFEEQRKASEQEAYKSRQLTTQVSTFSQTETELRSQLNIYVEKFKQVEDTLNNSNDLFLTFRKEMEEMSKKTKRLEKENNTLTRKHDLTNHNILQMAEERTKDHQEIDLLTKKNQQLEQLCRGMQEQGRGRITAPLNGPSLAELESEGTEDSEYEEDEYSDADEDDDRRAGEVGDYGAFDDSAGTRPPPQQQTSGAPTPAKVNGQLNGIKH